MMHSRFACVYLLGLAALAAGCSSRDQERTYRSFFRETAAGLVPGYGLPPESEYGPLWGAVEGMHWESRDGSGRTKAEFWTSGDFNGDSVVDFAYVLSRLADGERALFALLSSAEGYVAVPVARPIEPRMWVQTRGPGRYETAAAKGAGPDSADAVLEFEVTYQGIEFFQTEGASSTFVWNEATNGFDRYWTSD